MWLAKSVRVVSLENSRGPKSVEVIQQMFANSTYLKVGALGVQLDDVIMLSRVLCVHVDHSIESCPMDCVCVILSPV
jgi:hypothetical protein